MKLGFLSDIHLDSNDQFPVKENIAKYCNENKIDYLLIAGDIYSNYYNITSFLNYMKRHTNTKVGFVPGNHDLYKTTPSSIKPTTSDKIYEELSSLPECVVNNPIELGDWVILGETGWYDYSFRAKGFEDDELNRQRYKGFAWADKKHFKWGELSNKELHDLFMERIENKLKQYQDKNIIFLTHMVPFKEFVLYKGINDWDYFSAFIGSANIGSLLEKYGVKVVGFGHTHFTQYGMHGDVECICSPLGYFREWNNMNDIYKEISERIFIKEI